MSIIAGPKIWTRKPISGSQINRSHPLSQGIISAFLFNEGGSACFDLADTQVATTGAGALQWQESANFDGATYVQRGNPPFLSSAVINFSVTLRIKCTSSSRMGIVTNFDPSFNGFAVGMAATTPAGQIDAYFAGWYGGAGGTSIAVNDGKWHIITFTCAVGSPNVEKLYVDGVFIGSVALGPFNGVTTPLQIGKEETFFFSGQIDFVVLHSRTLTSSDVLQFHTYPYSFMQPQSPRPRYWLSANVAPPDTTVDMPPVVVYYPDFMMTT